MLVMASKAMVCTSPEKPGKRTIWRAVSGCTLMMRLLPRFRMLQPYFCRRQALKDVCNLRLHLEH